MPGHYTYFIKMAVFVKFDVVTFLQNALLRTEIPKGCAHAYCMKVLQAYYPMRTKYTRVLNYSNGEEIGVLRSVI